MSAGQTLEARRLLRFLTALQSLKGAHGLFASRTDIFLQVFVIFVQLLMADGLDRHAGRLGLAVQRRIPLVEESSWGKRKVTHVVWGDIAYQL